VWLDQRLGGGDAWWRAILEQIRGCEVFIFALSQHSIQSKPCQAELRYAQDLGLPILPVQVGPVDSMQLNPLATVQTIDYRTLTSTAGMRLLSALHRAGARRQPLPSPLPPEPPVPFEYLMRLYTTIVGTDQLSPRDQAALVTQLQFGLREDGDHDAARKDIVMLLTKLHDREDVTYRTRTDVDAILASIDTAAHVEGPSQPSDLSRATMSDWVSPGAEDVATAPAADHTNAKSKSVRHPAAAVSEDYEAATVPVKADPPWWRRPRVIASVIPVLFILIIINWRGLQSIDNGSDARSIPVFRGTLWSLIALLVVAVIILLLQLRGNQKR
jgi:TIR domain